MIDTDLFYFIIVKLIYIWIQMFHLLIKIFLEKMLYDNVYGIIYIMQLYTTTIARGIVRERYFEVLWINK